MEPKKEDNVALLPNQVTHVALDMDTLNLVLGTLAKGLTWEQANPAMEAMKEKSIALRFDEEEGFLVVDKQPAS